MAFYLNDNVVRITMLYVFTCIATAQKNKIAFALGYSFVVEAVKWHHIRVASIRGRGLVVAKLFTL